MMRAEVLRAPAPPHLKLNGGAKEAWVCRCLIAETSKLPTTRARTALDERSRSGEVSVNTTG